MKKMLATFALAATTLTAGTALATPSTQIWIPSTDVQAFGTAHLNIDNYFRASGVSKITGAGRDPNVLVVGPTIGVLPFEKLQAEIGFDYIVNGTEPADNHPFYFHAKLGTPEDSLFKYSPALAAGIYNLGTSYKVNNQNIAYGLAARTLPVVGRISAGGYHGAESALGKGANNGLLLSWDRTMSEISDKLWVAVDYMSGNNVNGSVNFGVSWAFSKNVSLIVGYDVYKEKALAGNNTITTQLDINIP